MRTLVARLSTAVVISWRKSLRIRDTVTSPITAAKPQSTTNVRPADRIASRQRIESVLRRVFIERARRPASCAQHVSRAADRVQQARLAAALQLAPQVGDEDL